MPRSNLDEMSRRGLERLEQDDPTLHQLLERESERQAQTLYMVAASSIADPSVLVCEATATTNVTTEGYPGARFHAGCSVVDEIERLAVDRAKAAFQAQYANVQPHSGTTANTTVIFSLLKPGDTILGLELNAGGHLTHGSPASAVGRYFNTIGYGLDSEGRIDYDQVARLTAEHRPRLLICGASAYPRIIDFKRFREIADSVGAYVLADVSHIAGLIVGSMHPSPIDSAHFTTTSTYKQLYGPRGGLILIGKDHEAPAPDGKRTLEQLIQRAVFPFFQGTPHLAAIAAKARALARVTQPEFRDLAQLVVSDARALAAAFIKKDYTVLTGGTDNHMVLIDILASKHMTGLLAEQALEECNIIVNKNRIAGDTKSAFVTSGLRLGTNSLALRNMGPAEMIQCTEIVDRILSSVEIRDDRDYRLPPAARDVFNQEVSKLCESFPIPHYPSAGP